MRAAKQGREGGRGRDKREREVACDDVARVAGRADERGDDVGVGGGGGDHPLLDRQ